MKRRSSYLGGSTIVGQNSNWLSREDDPASEDHISTFPEILNDYISEEIEPELNANQSRESGPFDRPVLGDNTKDKTAKLYVPADEGPSFVKKRNNSPFKKPRSKPLVVIKGKLKDKR